MLQKIPETDWPSLDNRVDVLAQAEQSAEAAARFAQIDPRRHDRARLLLTLARPAEALAALNPEVVLAMTINQWLYLPLVDSIRHEPRFVEFLAKLGLTEAHARAQAWRAAHPPEFGAVKR